MSKGRSLLNWSFVCLGCLVFFLGLVVLIGWYTRSLALIQIPSSSAPMQYNTALGFLVAGLGLLNVTAGRRLPSIWFGGFVGVLGFITLFEYIFGVSLGIDQLLMSDYVTTEHSLLGRMAPNAALCFGLTGGAVVMISREVPQWSRISLISSLIFIISLATFTGYIAGFGGVYDFFVIPIMPIQTSFGFILMGLALCIYSWSESGRVSSQDRRRFFSLTVIMAVVMALVLSLILLILFQVFKEQQRGRLVQLANNQAHFIEEIAKFNVGYDHTDFDGDAREEALNQLANAAKSYSGFGRTGEFTVGINRGGMIEIIVAQRSNTAELPTSIPFDGQNAEPMRRALSGEIGTLEGLDYKGNRVLAAYHTIPALGVGIVAKIDRDEVLVPFIRVGLVATVLAALAISLGTLLFRRITDPLIKRLEINLEEQEKLVIERSQNLLESVQQSQDILDNSSVGVVIVDPQTQLVLYGNRKLANLFGSTTDDLIGQSAALFHSMVEERNRVLTQDESSGSTVEVESLLKRVDGSIFDGLISMSKIRYEGMNCTMSWIYDITDRKKMEREIRSSEERLESVLESISVGVEIYSENGNTLFANPMCCKIFGTTLDVLLEEGTLVRWVDKHQRAMILGALEIGRQVNGQELEFYRANDEKFWCYFSVISIVYEGQRVFLSSYVDITKLKKQEDELSSLLESAPDATIVVSSDGLITKSNEELENLLGYRKIELIGEPVEIIVPEKYRHEHSGLRSGFVSKGGSRSMGGGLEIYAQAKSGEIIPVEINLSPIDSAQGQSVIAAIRNVTQRKEMEANLRSAKEVAENAVKVKSAFLATMSHEIRTPMNGIIGMVDLLCQSNLTDEHRHMIQTISESGQSLLVIIDDILDYSKMEAGKFELEIVDFSLLEVVESSMRLLKSNADDKGLDLIIYVDPLIPQFVLGDPVRMRQVLINLAGNAIKFTDRGQVIVRIDLENESEEDIRINFRVIDEGIGISDEGKSKLFEPFIQTDSSTARHYGGTGLGLSICQRLTEMMQSKIGVVSELGKGSEFHFAVSFKKSNESNQRAEVCDLSGLNIMLVTNSSIERFICQQYLEHAHASIITVDSISDVIDKAESCFGQDNPLDIVVLCSDLSAEQQRSIRKVFKQEESLRNISFVSLMKGDRRKPHLEDAEAVQVDVGPMGRIKFLTAVSIAAGKVIPEVYREDRIEKLNARNTALSIEDALQSNTLILVAEDNPINRDVISRQLNMLGYTCELAIGGNEALQAWKTGRYFLLLTDCHMPGMDGYGLAGAIRKEEEAKFVERSPIIAITASAMEGEDQKCLDAGMDDYLSKPIDMNKLGEKLLHWMPHSNLLEGEGSEELMSTDTNKSDKRSKDNSAIPAQDQTSTLDSNFDSNGLETALGPIDKRALQDMFGDDEETFKEILNDFIEPCRSIIKEIQVGCAAESAEAINLASHKLKSAARSVGATELGELCAGLESAGMSNDWNTINIGVPKLDALMSQLEIYIESVLKTV